MLLVGFIGIYEIRREGQDDPLILTYLTMIDPTLGGLKKYSIMINRRLQYPT